jgi:DNA polymerase zeta
MRILEDKVPVQDFIFAKEVRMGSYRSIYSHCFPLPCEAYFRYSDKLPPPPGVAVAAKRMIEDHSDGPQYGERVPYVIARGKPGSRLVDRAVDPREFLDNRLVCSCRLASHSTHFRTVKCTWMVHTTSREF